MDVKVCGSNFGVAAVYASEKVTLSRAGRGIVKSSRCNYSEKAGGAELNLYASFGRERASVRKKSSEGSRNGPSSNNDSEVMGEGIFRRDPPIGGGCRFWAVES